VWFHARKEAAAQAFLRRARYAAGQGEYNIVAPGGCAFRETVQSEALRNHYLKGIEFCNG